MEINFNYLQSQFKLYLKSLNKSNGNDVNFYKFHDDFKEFLKKDNNISSDLISMNLSDLLEQNFFDYLQTETEESENDNSVLGFLSGFFKNIFKDADFIKNIDKNGNNKIDKDEIDNFFSAIDIDGDKNITMDEIFNGIDIVKEGKYNDLLNGVYSSNNTNETNNNTKKNNNNTSKPLTNMTFSELGTEKSSREAALQKAQKDLASVYNGTNSRIKEAEKNCKEKKEEYDKAVENDEKISNELKAERQQNLDDISNKETDIRDKKASVSSIEADISTTDASIKAKAAEIQGLEAALNSYPNSVKDESEQQRINNAKTNLRRKIEVLKSEKQQEETALKKKEKERDDLKDSIKQDESQLDTLKTQKADIEKRILENCGEETKAALSAYNSAKEYLDKVKAEEESAAIKNLEKAQASLNEVNEVYNKRNEEKVENDNKYTGNFFNTDTEYNVEPVNEEGTIPYILMGPKNPDPNREYPVIVYLHGQGEFGGDENKLLSLESGPNNIMQNWNLENFDGYILMPHATGDYNHSNNWQNQNAADDIRALVTNFSSTHNVDSSRIYIGGHSVGGTGAVYNAEHNSDIFAAAFTLSGAETYTGSEVTIPTFVAASAAADSQTHNYVNSHSKDINPDDIIYFGNGVGKDGYASHMEIPGLAFNYDSNENGRSDLIEWLFLHAKKEEK